MHAFKFIGGPLDGEAFEYHALHAIADIVPLSAQTANRRLLLMPPLDDCERILRGEIRKEDLRVKKHPYEQVLAGGGTVEYHATKR